MTGKVKDSLVLTSRDRYITLANGRYQVNSMRSQLIVLTIILFLIGFFAPWVWAFAVISAVSAMVNSSGSLQAGAREQTNGMIDGMRDDNSVSQKSKSCPACLGTVSRYAAKCQFCGEILEVTPN